jgi:hypothetical protein
MLSVDELDLAVITRAPVWELIHVCDTGRGQVASGAPISISPWATRAAAGRPVIHPIEPLDRYFDTGGAVGDGRSLYLCASCAARGCDR